MRRVARLVARTITRAPWTWRFLRRPVTRFFDRVASGWDERFASSPDRLVALEAALAHLPAAPRRVLDVGTGTGAAAFLAKARWPEAEVTGIDVAPEMIRIAHEKSSVEAAVRFMVADVTHIDPGPGYDLVVLLNMPPFFPEMARLLRPGGHLVSVASRGACTPFYIPAETLARGFEQHGLATVASGTGGPGTYYVARRR